MNKTIPPPINSDQYKEKVLLDYYKLLGENPSDEEVFQKFFEKNPNLIPGSRGELDSFPSGHGPLLGSLITQPKIRGIINRQPDFMWLSLNSMFFSPVIIEIEAPEKKYFNKDGTPTADFTKAKNQIDEWKMILSKPENILLFYEDYNIPLYLRRSIFKPFFLLIYGRRSEYIDNDLLRNKRATLVDSGANQYIMSFDRIYPSYTEYNYVTCLVKDGKYTAKYLSPTFKLGFLSPHIAEISNLVEAANGMSYTSKERKEFLKGRFPYWINELKNAHRRRKEGLSKDSFTIEDILDIREE